jgi:hypothetical protein
MKSVPTHHKEIARHLQERFSGRAQTYVYRDDNGKRPVPIAQYGERDERFYSTIGVCDATLGIPSGRFEFAAVGNLPWLPNTLVSSVYWLRDRHLAEWPLVCEDVIRNNVRSTYRHMAYVPSKHSFLVSSGETVRWLLGVPIKDSEIGLDIAMAMSKIDAVYPRWFNDDSAWQIATAHAGERL